LFFPGVSKYFRCK